MYFPKNFLFSIIQNGLRTKKGIYKPLSRTINYLLLDGCGHGTKIIFEGLWLYKTEGESGFLSNRYKELDCRTNGFLSSLESSIRPIWRSGYIAYKRFSASASCYVNDSYERLKLPFTHICDRLSPVLERSLGFIFGFGKVIYRILADAISLARNSFSNFFLFLLDFFSDFISAINNVLYNIYKYFTDILYSLSNSLNEMFGFSWKVLGNAIRDFWSYLYLLFFYPKSEVKYEYKQPEFSGDACLRQQKSFDKLTSDVEDFKSLSWDMTSMKKKINELETELEREKEFRKNQNKLFDKQLDDSHKTLQKFQAAVNHALFAPKRPAHVSTSGVQYLLDNQSDILRQWMTKNFLLKSDGSDIDENKLALLFSKYNNQTREELLALKQELKFFMENHKTEFEYFRKNFNALETNNFESSDISLNFIKKLIADAIKLYDADKTGKVDYALETGGGQVLSIRCTETYMESPKSYVLLKLPIYTEASSPWEAIRPRMAAGQCWAFVGSQGFLVLKLSHTIKVTGFTMEHISKSLVPKGHIESAPQNFSMWGLKDEHDVDPYLFGDYAYLDNGETLQYFPVTYATNEFYNVVELKITSNHGNPNYTCLYRIRVHGDLKPTSL